MIKIKWSIEDANLFQTGTLPDGAVKIEGPKSADELMKKAFPIALAMILILAASMFIKTFLNHGLVFFPPAILIGVTAGFLLFFVHEFLHAAVYPKKSEVTIEN